MLYDILSQISNFFYSIAPWQVALGKIILLLLAFELGLRVGHRIYKKNGESKPRGGNIILTSTFAILGLLFAFTFSASVYRHDLRKQELLNEANAIGTAFLRAGLVAEPGRSSIKQILLDYGRSRIVHANEMKTSEYRSKTIAASSEKITQLWPATEAAVFQQPQPGAVEMSLVAAVNDVIDQNTIRNAAALDRLPAAILWMLILVSVIAMAEVGQSAGLSGQRSRLRSTVFVIILSFVMMVITDFDRSRDGLIRISQTPLKNTVADMEASLGNR